MPKKEKKDLEKIQTEEKEILENKIKKKQNKQVFWAVILMGSIIIILLAVPILTKLLGKFSYINLEFQKTKLGKITFYSAYIPLSDLTGNIIGSYPINFRNDPRKLEYIKVDVPDNQITFKRKDIIYLSLEPSDLPCEDDTIAVVGITNFLKDFGAMQVKGASVNESYAKEIKFPYVTCKTHPDNTVILIKNKNETKINKISANCYELSYKECEILQVTEKFQLAVLEGYMSYFEERESSFY
ncbi:hypothetical protein J4437_05810 [Candidatus Woesearchaeota archaeon]|nr:hypothetical protein [Candidatus Woesearchaeota archaeon]